ncbi:hypothetical protein NLG97_g8270 [Lecanicillium saksenae]|uniref:Uncharacterized protein n=1 Tax=Lecanicillium saksenae TaxID=468837 RepID=A0ACC1QLB5_9HYPO|nr:hypothetical protein NLG97_g8270 [Lecanicillium saksenae]
MCLPGVDQTERSPQRWHIVAPKVEMCIEDIKSHARLYLFELLQSKSFHRSIDIGSAANLVPPSTTAPKSTLECLPSEILNLIFSCPELSRCDMMAFGLSSTHLWSHFLRSSVGKSDTGMLSGTPLFCIGNYLRSYPKILSELYTDLDDDWMMPLQGVPGRFIPVRAARAWLRETLFESTVLLDDGVFHSWINILHSIKDHGIGYSAMHNIESCLRGMAGEQGVGEAGQKWFLRNLKTHEYVRLEASVEPDETGQDRYDSSPEDEPGAAKITRGEAMTHLVDSRPLVATVESAPWLSLDTGLFFMTMYPNMRTEDGEDGRESPWVGHEFDILSGTQWQSFERDNWTDATAMMIDASVELRPSVLA